MRAWMGVLAVVSWVGCAERAVVRRSDLLGERENRVLQLRGEPDAVDFVRWPQPEGERPAGPTERWTYCEGSTGRRCTGRLEVYLRNGAVWATRRVEVVPEGSGSP